MPSQVIVMDMIFNAENVPEFGSIRLTNKRYNSVNDYVLKSADVAKLDLITNAAEGSTAFCTDTYDLYILHVGEWVSLDG